MQVKVFNQTALSSLPIMLHGIMHGFSLKNYAGIIGLGGLAVACNHCVKSLPWSFEDSII